jgi:hypothetical protein
LEEVKVSGLSVNVVAVDAKIIATIGNLLTRVLPRELKLLFQKEKGKVVIVHASEA